MSKIGPVNPNVPIYPIQESKKKPSPEKSEVKPKQLPPLEDDSIELSDEALKQLKKEKDEPK